MKKRKGTTWCVAHPRQNTKTWWLQTPRGMHYAMYNATWADIYFLFIFNCFFFFISSSVCVACTFMNIPYECMLRLFQDPTYWDLYEKCRSILNVAGHWRYIASALWEKKNKRGKGKGRLNNEEDSSE